MRRIVLAAGVLLAFPCAPLHAQGAWDAILTIDPYPSPYYSDWDADPNISSLTLINSTASAAQVRIHFNVIDRTNRVVVSGTSEPELVGAGATVIFDSPYDVAGSTTHDAEMEDIAARTGRLPEGDYTACAVAADPAGFVLAESCSMFSIVYPDPPLLLGPLDGEALEQPDPLFLWTPVQVPLDYQLTYILRVAEVLSGQTAAEALRSNIPHYQSLDGQMPSLRYPIDARPLEAGKTYAWTVQALDQNGYAASANDGRSEIWSFRYEDGTTPVTNTVSTVPLTLSNATDREGLPPVQGLDGICRSWSTPEVIQEIVYPTAVRFVFPRMTQVLASLVRDTVPGSNGRRGWILYGSNDRHMLMLSGDCGINNDVTRTRWLAIRTAGDAQELSDWGPGDEYTLSTGEADAKLKFGVAVLAAREETIGGDESFPAIQEFLEGFEVEVKPGLNLYGVLDARLLKVWPMLEALGHDRVTAEIELQGYAGVNTNVAAEGIIGNEDMSAGVGLTQEFLILRAAMPERRFDRGPIRSVRTGLELSFGDSAGLALGNKPDLSLHPVVKLTVDMVDAWEVKWAGALEIDIGIDLLDDANVDTKPTLRLTADTAWYPWGESVALGLGNPEIAVAVNAGLFNAITSADAKQLDADVTLRGSVLLHDQDIAKAAITIGRHADDPKGYWEKQVGASSEDLTNNVNLLRQLRQSESDARTRGDTIGVNQARARQTEVQQVIDASRRQLRRDSVILAGYEKRYDDGNRTRVLDREKGKWYWKASLTLGSMGLSDMLDLIRDIGLAVAARREDGPP